MNKPQAHTSAFFTLRPLLALTFGCLSVALVILAFGNTAALRDGHSSPMATGLLGRIASVFSGRDADVDRAGEVENKQSAKYRRSMMGKSTDGATTASSASTQKGPADPMASSRIAAHQNELGQTVYAVSASGFDLSPPLRNLAKLPDAAFQNIGQKEEWPFPAFRIPHSDQRDPVVQAAPGPRNKLSRALSPDAPDAATTGFNFLGVIGTGSYPPDTNGSVGNDQYVETVNTRYQAWSLNRATNTPTSLIGPIN